MQLDSQYYSEQELVIDEPGDEDADGTDERGGEGGTVRIGGNTSTEPKDRPEALAPGGKPLSARLYDELSVQRRDILASSILAQPALALDYALFSMVDARTNSSSRYLGTVKYGTTIRASGPQDPVTGDMPSSRARDYLAEARDGLDAAWTEHACEVDRFEAFRALDDDTKANWLAYIVAISLEAKPGYSNEQIKLHNRLASILEIDVATWWRPTSENFFDRVNKASILSLLTDIGGPALTVRHTSLKKTEISESCQKLFAGEAIVEPEVKEAALAWVPNAMRFLDQTADVPTDPTEVAGDEAADNDGEPPADDAVTALGDELLESEAA
jgi:ParB family chromosome partitioning protein